MPDPRRISEFTAIIEYGFAIPFMRFDKYDSPSEIFPMKDSLRLLS